MTCEYVPVSKWDNVDVCMWINGLSEMLSQHVSQFKLHSITGCDLLKLSRQQLLYLKVNQLGHQELLLEAVELLALVDNARSRQSTISLASALSKTTSQLIKALTDFEKIKDSSQHLICIEVGASILEAAKFLIGWLDRFPTELICDYFSFRLELLKSCLNLASSLDMTVLDTRNILEISSSFLKLTSGLMSPEFLNKTDPLTNVTLTLVTDTEKGLGFSIQRTRRGALVISNIEHNSPADQCKLITEGVEIIQINQQNVVCWEVKNVVKSLRSCGHEVKLTVRVRHIDVLFKQDNINTYDMSSNSAVKVHKSIERVSSGPEIYCEKIERRGSDYSPDVHLPLVGDVIKHTSLVKKLPSIVHHDHLESNESSSPANSQSILAYKTEIIGGVVHRIPIKTHEDNSVAVKVYNKSGSSRRSHKKDGSRPLKTECSPLPLSQQKPSEGFIKDGCDEKKGDSDSIVNNEVSIDNAGLSLFIPCFQIKNPDFDGWMNKLGGSGLTPKNWRRRWFVLAGGLVYYYKSIYDIQALGIINLFGYKLEETNEVKKKNAFKAFKSDSRTYYFSTDTAENMIRWMTAMKTASQLPLKQIHNDICGDT